MSVLLHRSLLGNGVGLRATVLTRGSLRVGKAAGNVDPGMWIGRIRQIAYTYIPKWMLQNSSIPKALVTPSATLPSAFDNPLSSPAVKLPTIPENSSSLNKCSHVLPSAAARAPSRVVSKDWIMLARGSIADVVAAAAGCDDVTVTVKLLDGINEGGTPPVGLTTLVSLGTEVP
ncbi:uncharacterized protein PAC_08791 [Phialocephala subalpina]|uniref:Uncharacterized protein n=1 Tax=Phialocephala subalpina TaxID=576137 RepID=A0A1L7X1Q5_9HELO|nr:uncharacterized protein PAC_08791 [Phialocephala subalpina]